MTRDTKIGLLLGLVFIFIIAFLINGLPRLRGRGQGTDTRMTRIQSSSPGPGLAAKERLVREMAEQSPGMPGSPYTRVMPVGLNPQGLPGSTEIRSTMPLPGTVESQSSVASSGSNPVPTGAVPSGQPQLNGELGSAGPVTPSNGVFPAAANTVVPVRSLAPASQTTGSVGALSPAASTLPSPSAMGVLSPSPVVAGGPQTVGVSQQAAPATTRVGPSEWPKTYVVKEGDSLEAIAKQMYGAPEGVKPASIKRIFEANKSLLKSPDHLSIGQKLTIPAPAGASTAIASIARLGGAATKSAVGAPADSQGQRWYVVQAGDSLWKIATAQLGKDTRYKEILKLNADVLKNNEDNLELGMKLRLPAK